MVKDLLQKYDPTLQKIVSVFRTQTTLTRFMNNERQRGTPICLPYTVSKGLFNYILCRSIFLYFISP